MLPNPKLLFACVTLALSAQRHILAEKFEFLNKTNATIEYVIGSRANPPKNNQRNLKAIEPGKSGSNDVNNAIFPQILFHDKATPDVAFIYELTPKPGKKVYVRLIDEGKGPRFEPQTFVYNNLDKNDIRLVGTIGTGLKRPESSQEKPKPQPTPQPAPSPAAEVTEYDILGLRKGATDAEILGLSAEEIKDKAAVKKAYFKLSRTWHPDKIKDNETAKKAYATYQNEINKLDKQDQQNLPGGVFSLIQGAYERNR